MWARKKDEASNRRPAFSYDEYLELSEFLRTWVGFTGNWKRRDLLRWYFHILVQSGMRPGSETDGLRWCDVRRFKEEELERDGSLGDPVPTNFSFEQWVEPTHDGNTYNLELTVTGKTGRRTLVPTRQVNMAFYAIRDARETHLRQENGWDKLPHPGVDPEERVFCLRDGTFQSADSLRPLFKRLLEDAGLLNDPHGKARTFYSCRHTYATLRLLYKQVPVHTLAVNMGTSVGMIEKHYSHLTARMAVDQLE
jgi:integrase